MGDSEQAGAGPLLVLVKISEILDAFTLDRPALTIGEIRAATGFPASTVQRLVTNLVALGFLDRQGDSSGSASRWPTGQRQQSKVSTSSTSSSRSSGTFATRW